MEDQSRLLRHDQVASMFHDECTKQGVTLHTRDGQYDLSSSGDNLPKQRPEAVAEVDNTTRAERTYLSRLNRVRSGHWHSGPPPYGYRLQDRKLAIDPIEAQWVKRMFEMSATGASPAAIKKTLDAQGVTTRTGGLWSTRSVAATLQSPHYAGQYTYVDASSGQQIPVLCPQIVNATTWEAVQVLQSRHEHRHRQKNATRKHFYLLRDLMYCAHCGRPISGRQNPLRGEAVYYCANKDRSVVTDGTGHGTPRQRGSGCGMVRSMNIHRADERVLKHIQKLHARSSLLREALRQQVLDPQGWTHMLDSDDTQEIDAEIRRLQKDLSAVSEAIGGSEASKRLGHSDEIGNLTPNKRLEHEQRRLITALADIRCQFRGTTARQQWSAWIDTFGCGIQNHNMLDDQQLKHYVEGIVERIDVRWLPEQRAHELMMTFRLPIVGDGVRWHDAKQQSQDLTLVEGRRTDTVVLQCSRRAESQ